MSIATVRDILDFWFKETPPERHFTADPALDETIRTRFEETWRVGGTGALQSWTGTMEGALGLIVLLDQFPRNMFRGKGEGFSTDALARQAAHEAIARGFDVEAPAGVRSFFYLPLMHSEDLGDQQECVLFTRERLGQHHFSYPFAQRHRDTILRFGRFPARNAALSRASTDEEIEFLKTNPMGF